MLQTDYFIYLLYCLCIVLNPHHRFLMVLLSAGILTWRLGGFLLRSILKVQGHPRPDLLHRLCACCPILPNSGRLSLMFSESRLVSIFVLSRQSTKVDAKLKVHQWIPSASNTSPAALLVAGLPFSVSRTRNSSKNTGFPIAYHVSSVRFFLPLESFSLFFFPSLSSFC